MRSKARTIKVPTPLIEALESLRRPGEMFDDYPSTNAALVGLIRYAVIFPRRHLLTAAIARLPESEQDQIDDFIAGASAAHRSLGTEMPKPATVTDLLNLARKPAAAASRALKRRPQTPT